MQFTQKKFKLIVEIKYFYICIPQLFSFLNLNFPQINPYGARIINFNALKALFQRKIVKSFKYNQTTEI